MMRCNSDRLVSSNTIILHHDFMDKCIFRHLIDLITIYYDNNIIANIKKYIKTRFTSELTSWTDVGRDFITACGHIKIVGLHTLFLKVLSIDYIRCSKKKSIIFPFNFMQK